jgi:hypothetical protein
MVRRTGSDAEAVQAMPKSLHLPVLITHGLNGLRRLFPERGCLRIQRLATRHSSRHNGELAELVRTQISGLKKLTGMPRSLKSVSARSLSGERANTAAGPQIGDGLPSCCNGSLVPGTDPRAFCDTCEDHLAWRHRSPPPGA